MSVVTFGFGLVELEIMGAGGQLPASKLPMLHSPVFVLYQHLVDGLQIDAAGATALGWQGVVSNSPHTKEKSVTLLDTTPFTEGRSQRTGHTFTHPGAQVVIRCNNYNTGYVKAAALKDFLERIFHAAVSIDAQTYRIDSVGVAGDIVPFGPDPDTRQDLFSLNMLATIHRLS